MDTDSNHRILDPIRVHPWLIYLVPCWSPGRKRNEAVPERDRLVSGEIV